MEFRKYSGNGRLSLRECSVLGLSPLDQAWPIEKWGELLDVADRALQGIEVQRFELKGDVIGDKATIEKFRELQQDENTVRGIPRDLAARINLLDIDILDLSAFDGP